MRTMLMMAMLFIRALAPSNDMVEFLVDVSSSYGFEPELISTIIEEESEWNEDAVSSCGAIGLMQICPEWHEDRMQELGITDITDPKQNIVVGCDYLRELTDQYNGNVLKALMVYNMGNRGAELYEDGIISTYAEHIVIVMERKMDLRNYWRLDK